MRSQKKHNKEIFFSEILKVDKEGNSVTFGERLWDEDYSIDEDVGRKMDICRMYKAIEARLNPREKLILQKRYGLDTGEETTQRETAKLLDISRSYVSRLEKRALKKLSQEMGSSE